MSEIRKLDQFGQDAHVRTMDQVNLYQAKTNLSSLVERAAAGEEIVIAKNGKARARLVPMPEAEIRKPKFGAWKKYGWKLPENFDDPDPEIEALFNDGPI